MVSTLFLFPRFFTTPHSLPLFLTHNPSSSLIRHNPSSSSILRPPSFAQTTRSSPYRLVKKSTTMSHHPLLQPLFYPHAVSTHILVIFFFEGPVEESSMHLGGYVP